MVRQSGRRAWQWIADSEPLTIPTEPGSVEMSQA